MLSSVFFGDTMVPNIEQAVILFLWYSIVQQQKKYSNGAYFRLHGGYTGIILLKVDIGLAEVIYCCIEGYMLRDYRGDGAGKGR